MLAVVVSAPGKLRVTPDSVAAAAWLCPGDCRSVVDVPAVLEPAYAFEAVLFHCSSFPWPDPGKGDWAGGRGELVAEKDPVALGLRPRFAPPVFAPGVELRGCDAAAGFACMKGLSGAGYEEKGEVMFR